MVQKLFGNNMKVNVAETLARLEKNKHKARPLPKVTIIQEKTPTTKELLDEFYELKEKYQSNDNIEDQRHGYNNPLIQELESELSTIKVQRAKLSTAISKMVNSGSSKNELGQLHTKIACFKKPIQEAYDKLEYVKKHGELPKKKVTSESELQLKDKKRKLVDLRSKLKKKLQMAEGKGNGNSKVLEWEQSLDRAELEYKEVEQKLAEINEG